MNAFFYPSKRGINFAKIRGFKVTDYIFGTGTMPPGTSVPSPRGEGGLLAGLRHGSPAHRYLSAIPAWRRGSSDRSSARRPCPQVLQWHPRVAKGSSGRSSARGPYPQIPQWHSGVAKGRKSVPLTGLRSGLGPGLARGPCAQVLQRHSGVAKGTSIDPLARGPSTEPLLG